MHFNRTSFITAAVMGMSVCSSAMATITWDEFRRFFDAGMILNDGQVFGITGESFWDLPGYGSGTGTSTAPQYDYPDGSGFARSSVNLTLEGPNHNWHAGMRLSVSTHEDPGSESFLSEHYALASFSGGFQIVNDTILEFELLVFELNGADVMFSVMDAQNQVVLSGSSMFTAEQIALEAGAYTFVYESSIPSALGSSDAQGDTALRITQIPAPSTVGCIAFAGLAASAKRRRHT